MPLMLLEVDPAEILVEESRFQPDLMEPALIYEHLLYCCSKSSLLPTIFIQIENDAAFVVRGQWFLSIARDLNATRIRAIVDEKSDFEAVQRFLRRPSVTQIEWEEARKIEAESSSVEYRWLVFFFERPLTESERRAFESQICGFYRSLKAPTGFPTEKERIKNLSYSHDGLCAEFRALVPFGDERWYPASRAALEKFHRDVVPVVSFQGYRVEFWSDHQRLECKRRRRANTLLYVAETLDYLEDDRAVPALIRSIEYQPPGDDGRHFNKKVIYALARIGSWDALEGLKKATRSDDEIIRKVAADELSRLGFGSGSS